MGVPLLTGDRVLQLTTTTGTGTYQLGAAAATTYRTMLLAGVASGSRVMYVVQDDPLTPTQWEECEGIYTAGSPDTLTRATVRGGSNGTSPVNWGSGTKYVYLTAFANRLALLDTDGKLPLSVMPFDVASRISTDNGSWTGTFDLLNGTDTVLFAIGIPEGTQRILFTGWARLQNISATVADATLSAKIINSQGAVFYAFPQIGLGTGSGSQSETIGLAGQFSVPALAAGLQLGFFARKEQAVGPYYILNAAASAMFVK
jgi:hypothetical protein